MTSEEELLIMIDDLPKVLGRSLMLLWKKGDVYSGLTLARFIKAKLDEDQAKS